MKHRHAYLIMAHHRLDLLQELVSSLDHVSNDIFIHVDKKCKEQRSIETKYSKIVFVKRKDVRWGGFSQIKCELDLLNTAVKSNQKYAYYHLLTGVSYPIKPQDYILDFFEANDGFEFVGFDNEKDYSKRVKYYYLFSELGKVSSRFDEQKKKFRDKAIRFQKRIGINRLRNSNYQIKKGSAYWSITEKFAKYILSKHKEINKMYKHTLCCDEVFVQTLLFNSPFREKVYCFSDEYIGSCVAMAWKKFTSVKREGMNFSFDDFELLSKCKMLYALKFESDEGMQLIKKINNELLKCYKNR